MRRLFEEAQVNGQMSQSSFNPAQTDAFGVVGGGFRWPRGRERRPLGWRSRQWLMPTQISTQLPNAEPVGYVIREGLKE
jgi:hypothetical protein